jgi:hypothetical protein
MEDRDPLSSIFNPHGFSTAAYPFAVANMREKTLRALPSVIL